MLDLRTPKGTIDYPPQQCKCIENILQTAIKIFQKHGAVPIDTPSFELRPILLNKYGSDTVNIFHLEDQGGDQCSLRFDLTVSLARYIATNQIKKLKRYQIGKVFRRDQPAITKGRFREFWQCDLDICGDFMPMTADAEIIKTAVECMNALVGEHKVVVNDRRLLNMVFERVGVDKNSWGEVCSSVDKMSKITERELRGELVNKGLSDQQVTELLGLIGIKGGWEVFDRLNEYFDGENYQCVRNEFMQLKDYLEAFDAHKSVVIDLSLARGAEYYTGLIFECFSVEYPEVGAVAGGGRYDNLVDSLVDNKFSVPCVGFSLGVLRIYAINKNKKRESESLVYVISKGKLFLRERMGILNMLWSNNIPAETFYTNRNSIQDHRKYMRKMGIPVMVVVGEREWEDGMVVVEVGESSYKVKTEELDVFIKEKIENKN